MVIRLNTAPEADNTVEVPLQTSFHSPQGRYSATVRTVKKGRQSWSSGQSIVRFVFNVNVPGSNIQYLAKLDLAENLNEGSDLWNVLCRLVGRKALQECSGGKFDLNSLIGLTCDIETQHIHDYKEEHEHPLVIVTDLREAGTWPPPAKREDEETTEEAETEVKNETQENESTASTRTENE